MEKTYDEMWSDLAHRIEGLRNQIDLTMDRRNTIIQVNRVAKTAMEVFNDILSKDHLERKDLDLILDSIKVFEDHIEVHLTADIDSLIHCGNPQPDAATVAQ